MDGAFGIILKNNREKILLVKHRDMPIWVLPGGGLEQGETPEQAVIREVYEETGLEVVVNKKVGEYKYPGSDKVNHTFVCTKQGGVYTLSKESKEIEYFNVGNLPDMISPFAVVMMGDALHNKNIVVKRILNKLPISFWIKGLLHPWALFKYLLVKIGIHWNT